MRTREHFGVFIDIDGTLVPDGSMTVSERLVRVFSDISSAIPLHLLTGRTESFAEDIFEILQIDQLCATENGGTIINPRTGETDRELYIEESTCELILHICSELVGEYQCRITGDSNDIKAQTNERFPRKNKGVFILDLEQKHAQVIEEALAHLPVYTHISSSFVNGSVTCDINIHHPEANKGSAVRYIGTRSNYDLSRCIAIGNDLNDLPMLNQVGTKVAPEDAHPKVLEVANIVIPSAANEGVAELLLSLL